MSLIPFLMEIAHEIGEMNRGIDDNFGFGIYPHEIHSRPSCGNRNKLFWVPPKHRLHPYENLRKKNCCPKLQKEKSFDEDDGEIVKSMAMSEVTNTPANGFQVSVNVQQFKPNELTVKVVDNHVVVDGRHDERLDEHGLISRQFQRKYLIPKGIDSKGITSSLSSDGILTVKAPPPHKPCGELERFIEIQHTGPAHLTVKDNNGHAEQDEEMICDNPEPPQQQQQQSQQPQPQQQVQQKPIQIETNGNGEAAPASEEAENEKVTNNGKTETTEEEKTSTTTSSSTTNDNAAAVGNSENSVAVVATAAAAPAATVAAKKSEESVVVAATTTTTTTNEDNTTQTPKISVVAVAAQTQPGQCENGGVVAAATDTPIATAAPIEAAN